MPTFLTIILASMAFNGFIAHFVQLSMDQIESHYKLCDVNADFIGSTTYLLLQNIIFND